MLWKGEKNIIYDKKIKVIVKITNITPFGAFCELKDADGLINISEFSDFFVRDIREFVNVGDSVEVEVLDFDPVKKHVKLSYKNCRPELLKKDNNPTEKTLPNSETLPNKHDLLSK